MLRPYGPSKIRAGSTGSRRANMLNVGFIGLGTMGRPMALHLLRRGYPVGVYARRREAAAPLVAAGAVMHDTPAALGEASDAVITTVTATRDVEGLLIGPG